jgi:hypothetical protein
MSSVRARSSASVNTHRERTHMSTPYDLRFNIYNQAQERLMAQYYSELGIWEQTRHRDEDPGEKPIFPAHENILEEAEKIYEFVQKKG